MKHTHHCHCGLKSQLAKLRAGKLGLLGIIFIVGHLLFHVAECLVIPAIFMAASGNAAESAELSHEDLHETAITLVLPRSLNGLDLRAMRKVGK